MRFAPLIPDLIIRRLIIQFPPLSFVFISLKPKHLQRRVPETQPMFFRNMTDQVLHPHNR